ncbi:MAG: ABC transporter permease [Verrucomicrobia bacterium]|nr:ABC transporter permease [Verrucomicrobiota bacterium]
MERLNHILKRVLFLIPLILVISFLAFCLVRVAPGGPFDSERKPASKEIEKNLAARYHLDQPVWKQYLYFLNGIAHGDLGASLKYRNHTVTDIIKQGLPISMMLGILSFGLALGIGVPLGFIAAIRKGTWVDYSATLLALAAICVPGFILSPMLILIFSIYLGIFPVALWGSFSHIVLPVFALGIYFSGRVARLTREGMITALQSDFIVTARAKGLSDFSIYFKHALRLGILPVLSYSGPLLADLLTGSFIVENIFQIPGIGVFMVNSSLNRDYTMVVGLALVYSILLLFLNLLVDILYSYLDPRIKLQ